MILSQDDFNLIRQWFNAVQDINPSYLESKDYELMKKIETNEDTIQDEIEISESRIVCSDCQEVLHQGRGDRFYCWNPNCIRNLEP